MSPRRAPLLFVAIVAAASIAAVLVVAAARLRFPYDVEWMEGGVLMQAERIAHGRTPYPAPSASFVPFLYPPLYPALLAALGALAGGPSYALGRGLSLAATALAAGLGGWAVLRATRRYELALLTVGLEAALAGFCGGFFDLVRPDALAIALVASGAALAFRGGRARLVVAGLALAAACFAKQTSLVAALGVLAGVGLVRGRRALAIAGATAAVAGLAGVLLLERATGGRFALYVLAGHRSHVFLRDNLAFYFERDALHLAPLLLVLPLVWLHRVRPSSLLPAFLAAHLAIAVAQRALVTRDLPHMYYRDLWYPHALWWLPPLAIAALSLHGAGDARPRASRHARYWGAIFVGALLASALGHSTQWAFRNSSMPLALLGAPFVVIALAELAGTSVRASRWLAAAVLVQLVALFEPTSARAPGEADRRAWDGLRARLAREPGKVMVLAHPRLSWELGAGEHLHAMGIQDVAGVGGVPDLERRLAAHEWSVIVTDAEDWVAPPPVVERYYRRAERLEVTPMKTGSRCRPTELWVPRGE